NEAAKHAALSPAHQTDGISLIDPAEVQRNEPANDAVVTAGHVAEGVGVRDDAGREQCKLRTTHIRDGNAQIRNADVHRHKTAHEAASTAGHRPGRSAPIDLAGVEGREPADVAV